MTKPPTHSLPTWDLRPLIRNEKEITAIQRKIRAKTAQFTTYRKKLENPTRELVECILHDLEEIGLLSGRLSTYATLRFSQNTQDEHAKALESRVSQFLTEQGNQTLFFTLWWKNQTKKNARKLLPKNAEYARHLRDVRRFNPHMLSEKEEQLANIKDTTGGEALVRLYDIITNAYLFEWSVKGKKQRIGEEELAAFHRSPDPRIRVKSYDLHWDQYRRDNGTLGEIYKNIALDTWNEGISLRKFKSPISIRNMDNQLSDGMVESFLRVCDENTELFQDYFAWKSDYLGVKNSRYHVYAPLHPTNQKYSFEAGYAHVMSAFAEFAPWFAEEAQRVRTHRRMDVGLRPGKQGGAFCADIPHETSYMHLNYTNTFLDVSTLAHELGHAVHHHVAGHHSIFGLHTPLPLAETASTFAELLLTDKLLHESKDEKFARTVLAHQLDDAYASIPRQTSFCRFEQEAFEMIRAGQPIPELNAAYMRNLRTQLGKKMEIPALAQYEWTMVPHLFVHPFYVYAYSFGQLLVYALYQRYQKEGASFVRDYKKFLAYGGSREPEIMLLEMGFNPRARKSWQNGFDFLRTKLKTLQKMGE